MGGERVSEGGAEQKAWLGQVEEEIVDPERRIVDPHHHLWRHGGLPAYVLEDLWADTSTGHNVEKTVFMECGAEYRRDGPEHLRSLGEVEFVRDIARASRAGGLGRPEIAAIVSQADLTLGDAVADVIHQHEEASDGLFRGIRHSGLENGPEGYQVCVRAAVGLDIGVVAAEELAGLFARIGFDGIDVVAPFIVPMTGEALEC